MKKLTLILLGLTLTMTLAACGKPPTEEINATKAALDAAVSEGAEKYTPNDLKAVKDELAAANAEVKVQDDKLFKNYDKAKQMFVQLKVNADSLKAKVVTVKEQLKQQADTALADATAAVNEAATLLESAPQGKGSQADIAMMKADLQGLQTALAEVQPLINNGDYVPASERAAAIKDKANTISAEVKAAQEKMAASKKGKKK